MAEDQVGVTGQRFRIRSDGEIRSEFQGCWPSAVGVVLSTTTSAPCSCAAADQRSNVTDIQIWVARRLQPEQLRAIERSELGVLRGRREPNLHAHLSKVPVGNQRVV